MLTDLTLKIIQKVDHAIIIITQMKKIRLKEGK